MTDKSLYNTKGHNYTWKEEKKTPLEWVCHLCYAVTYQDNASEHLQWHLTLEETMQQRLQEQLANATVELLKMLGAARD